MTRAACGKQTLGRTRTRDQLKRRIDLLTAAIESREREGEGAKKKVEELEASRAETSLRSYGKMTPVQIERHWDQQWKLARSIEEAKRAVVCLGSTVVLERHYLEQTAAELATVSE